jgi:ABC-2 type transport system ATP-binding protein
VCDRITILFKGERKALGDVKDLLEVRDVTNIETRGLSAAQLQQLQQVLAQMGVQNAKITHPTTTLEDLFIRIVKENTPAGQTYTSSNQ